jgi:hypothetical protein
MSKEQFETIEINAAIEVAAPEIEKLDDISLALVGGGEAVVSF